MQFPEVPPTDTNPVAPVALRARALVKRFGPVPALQGVDLDLNRGELVVLLGPNGAGKSTLLRILATTLLPDSGSVAVNGIDALADPIPARKLIGVVLGEERSLYWRLTGRQNLEFFGALCGLRRMDLARRADGLLQEFGLQEAADRRVTGYSAGMRARLSLARALVTSPPILLLDEPSKSLDPMRAISFRQTLADLVKTKGVTALFATHDLHEAAALAHRVLVMVSGRIVHVEQEAQSASNLEGLLVGHMPAE